MMKIIVFDFDGTLTVKDSMIQIIIFHCGWGGLLWALLRQIHLVVLMMMRLYDNQRCKERLLAYCFGGMTEEAFKAMCCDFAASHRNIMRGEIAARLREGTTQEGKNVESYVITASPEEWVALFVPEVKVLGSSMEVVDGKITGKLVGRNCYGQEKVNRLLAAVPGLQTHRSDYFVTAYGDSRGDRELLAFADEPHFIH